MKHKPQNRIRRTLALAGLVFASAGSLGLAQSTITQNLNDAGSISQFGVDFGTGTVGWSATGGVDNSGCLVATLDATNAANKEISVKWSFPDGTLNASDYLQVDYFIKVDAASGVDADGKLGNYQDVFREGYGWDGHWVGARYPGDYADWTQMTVAVPNSGKLYDRLCFVLQGTAPYTTNVVFYIDNIVVTPVANPYVWDAFTNDISGWTVEGWTGVPGEALWNTTQDAGGGFTPLGSLQLSNSFTTGGQCWHQHSVPFAPSRWNFLEFDVKIDAANSVANSDGSYGQMQVSIRNPDWSDNWLPPGPFVMDASYTSWKHVKLSLGNHATNASSPAIDLAFTGNHSGPVVAFVDNIKLTKPVEAPRIYALEPGTPGGVKVFVDGSADNQWDEEGFTSPRGDNSGTNFFWMGQTPVSYSFTINHFPDPTVAPGFQAHCYVANGDTLTANNGDFGWNQTYSGIPWNVYDYAGLRVENVADGTVRAIFEWKTNSPSSNATNRYEFIATGLTSANGTWTLNFTDNTHGNIVGPGGLAVGSFQLPDFQQDPEYLNVRNFEPLTSCIQFGLSKNDTGNTGINNNQSAYFNRVVVTNAILGVMYDDDFAAPGLTAKYAWQIARYWKNAANRVLWQPAGTGYWLKYGDPTIGYSIVTSGSVEGPWVDAGVTYTYTDGTGTNHYGAIPTTSLPAGNAGYFRLMK